MPSDPMPLDWSTGELAAGLNCYQREEFFDAHEHWENIWRQSQGREKPFLQALIQVAGALHHYRRRNLRGCQALFRGAMRRLEPYPDCFGGVLLVPLRQELAAWQLAVEKSLARESKVEGQGLIATGAPVPSAALVSYPESYPKIHLAISDAKDQGDSGPANSQE